MSDPERLLSAGAGASDFEKDLLRSWDAEQPSEAARARVLAAAGLGVAATTAVATKLAAAGGSIAPKAALSAGGVAVAKWLAIGAVGLAVTGAAVGYARHSASVTRGSQAPAKASTVAATPGPAPVAPPESSSPGAPIVASAASETAETAPAQPLPAHARSRTPRPHPSALGEQVSALDSARRALASGDAPAALQALGDYEARFPDGALADEAEVLRVEALVANGDRATAGRIGQRFLAAHPNSPHAARVRALIAP